MAMSVGPGGAGGEPAVMATINTTPLVDVMLVLLIIFLISIPVITNFKKEELPHASNIPTVTKPENITISVDPNGDVYWNGAHLANRQQLLDKIKVVAVVKPQPEIHIRADKEARFESVGRVIYSIQRGGVVKVGFLTEPDHGTAVAH